MRWGLRGVGDVVAKDETFSLKNVPLHCKDNAKISRIRLFVFEIYPVEKNFSLSFLREFLEIWNGLLDF